MEISADDNPGASRPEALPAGPQARREAAAAAAEDGATSEATAGGAAPPDRPADPSTEAASGAAGTRSPLVGGMGSRARSPLGTQSDSTGMGDATPSGSSQGLAGAQGSGGGAERGLG